MNMLSRPVSQLLPALQASDGAGVKLLRSLGSRQNVRLDPFLMLDEFGSEEATDYIAGFPAHPHRGFETVTYMLEGHMLHEDSMGNKGDLRSGDVQWMTAARGIIHSEMPQQQEGLMRGFQLWINLPAKEKMKPASYRDIPAAQIPVTTLTNGIKVKVIAGTLQQDHIADTAGPIQGLTTEALYFDVFVPKGTTFSHAVPASHNAFVYLYEGKAQIGPADAVRDIPTHAAALLGEGNQVTVTATEDSRLLLLAGKPLHEPVVQYGPFVMNSREEIEQAIRDYQTGTLADAKALAG